MITYAINRRFKTYLQPPPTNYLLGCPLLDPPGLALFLPFDLSFPLSSLLTLPICPGPASVCNFIMQQATRNAWGSDIPSVRKGVTTSLAFACSQRISSSSTLRTIVVSRRTVISSSRWTCTPRVFPNSRSELLDQSIELEEEALPTYQPEKYYQSKRARYLMIGIKHLRK